ncbi:MAG: hypothetical protein WBF93_02035 [Pirellulales bacterium]|nr:hypothetical protein [Pirellulales bacterium]
MNRLILCALMMASLAIVGCGSETKIDNDGVDVKGENFGVKVNQKDGIGVKAPGVDINIGGGEGVKVKAPGVDVDLQSGEEK